MKTQRKRLQDIDGLYKEMHTHAIRVSRDLTIDVLIALKKGESVLSVLYAMLRVLEIQTTDVMLVAHLLGYLEAIVNAAKHLGEETMLGAYQSAVKFTQQRLGVTNAQLAILKERYGATAIAATQGMGDAVERKIQVALKEIVEKNYHIKQGMAHLSKAVKAAGINAANPWMIETMVRTEIQVAYGAGRWDANQSSEIQEILWGYEYVTAGDFRVRPEHEMLEGVRLPKEDPRWNEIWPPNGMNCRCEALEIYKDDAKRTSVKEMPAPKMKDGRLVIPGPDQGWAVNHGQIFTSDIAKSAEEIHAIVMPAKPIAVVKPVKKAKVKVSEALQKKYAAEFRLEGINEGYSDEVRAAYIQLRERFPLKIKDWDIGLYASEPASFGAKGPIANCVSMISPHAKGGNHFISLNNKFFGKKSVYDLRKLTAKMGASKWNTGNTVGDLVTHEYGHAIFNSMSMNDKQRAINFYNSYPKKDIAKLVSKYGSTDFHEMFAEMFVEHNKGMASELTKKLFSQLALKPTIIKKGVSKAAISFKEVHAIQARKTGWMKTIDKVVAKGKTPNWKATFWKNPDRRSYWEAATGQKFKKGVIKIKAKTLVKGKKIEFKGPKLKRTKTRGEFNKQITKTQRLTLGSWQGGPGIRRIQKGYFKGGALTGNAKSFQEALDQMPLFRGVMYRGGAIGKKDAIQQSMFKGVKTGKVITFKGPASASKDKTVAIDFILDRPTSVERYLLKIKTKGAPDLHKISSPGFKSEEEVMIEANKRYRVGIVRKIKELDAEYTEINLMEL